MTNFNFNNHTNTHTNKHTHIHTHTYTYLILCIVNFFLYQMLKRRPFKIAKQFNINEIITFISYFCYLI